MEFPLAELLEKPRCARTGKFSNSSRKIKSGIYLIFNRVSSKRYVGSALDVYARRRTHVRNLQKRTHNNKHLQKSFLKYGIKNFTFQIVEWVTATQELEAKEQYWIDKLLTCNPTYGYNYGSARGSQLGKIRTKTQVEISRSCAQRLWREGIFKRKASAKTRELLSESHLGIRRTLASRIKQSQTLRRKKALHGNKVYKR